MPASSEHETASARPQGTQSDFGYQTVDSSAKAGLVGDVFRSVAGHYDLMNDLMSFGAHRLWKRFAAAQSALRPGDAALDVAAGSGDLARHFARQVGPAGRVVLTDINPAMLAEGRDNLIDAGLVGNTTCTINYALADAEKLCFSADYFHCVSIAFGLRNITRKQDALAAMYRVTRPGGRLLLLEFAKPLVPLLDKAYHCYSFGVIPKLGKLVADDEDSYRYLVESIRRYPDRESVQAMMGRAGFEAIKIHNLSGGIVSLHIGFKY